MNERDEISKPMTAAALVVECGHPAHALSGLWKWRPAFGERGLFACVVCWPPVVDAARFGRMRPGRAESEATG